MMPSGKTGCAYVFVGALAIAYLTIGTTGAFAACYGPSEQLAGTVVSDFLANPSRTLQQFPNGGAPMISRVRDLAASNPATLQPIAQLLGTANKEQKTAIGTGLGQAARVCVKTDAAFANEIQQVLAATKDQEAILAYSSVTGDQPIGAAGAGAGAGAGAASGGAVGGPTSLPGTGFGSASSAAYPGALGVNTAAFSYTSSVNAGAGISVSPTR